jgi:hypothetical protein
MKKCSIKNLGLVGLFCAMALPATGFSASVESNVKEYMKDKDPQSITEYRDAFSSVFDKYTPIIKETTQAIMLYFFGEADDHSQQDIKVLANYAVTAAIVKARSDGNEDDLAAYITDAVCGSFKGGLHAAYRQVTSAGNTVEGALQAAIDSGIKPDYASTAVTRGIDTCLQQRLENDVAIILGQKVGNYIAPYQAYLPHTRRSGDPEVVDPPICVSNCL